MGLRCQTGQLAVKEHAKTKQAKLRERNNEAMKYMYTKMQMNKKACGLHKVNRHTTKYNYRALLIYTQMIIIYFEIIKSFKLISQVSIQCTAIHNQTENKMCATWFAVS